MTANDLIAAFEALAESPDGVKRLRELVLQLAVRGKLVPQEAGDEPATFITTELRRLRALGRKRAAKEDGESRELGFELPRGWASATVGELCSKIGAGSTPLGGAKVYVDDGIMFLRSQNVWNDGLRLHDVARILPETHERMAGTHVQPGDLLFNITGASIGRCGRVPATFGPANVSQHVTIIRPYLPTIQPFLHLVLISDTVQQRVFAEEVGVSREGLSIAKLGRFPIPLPPLAEQHRIVARVDELMSLLDRLEAARAQRDELRRAARDAALAALRDAEDSEAVEAAWGRIAGHMDTLFAEPEDVAPLRQAVLQLAVRGRLVPQDPKDEPAAQLVKRISVAKSKMLVGIRAYRETVEVNADNGPDWTLPKTWVWSRVHNIAIVRTGATPDRSNPQYWGGPVPWVSSGEVANCHILQTRESITEDALRESSVSMYPIGTVLIAMIGQGKTRGQSAVLDINATTNQNSAALILADGLMSSDYVWRWALSEYESSRSGGRGNAQPALNAAKIRALWIPIPPLAEQHRIVAKVDALMALCDTLEARLTAARDAQAAFAAAAVHHLDV